jgi:hypothetical protein
MMAQPQNMYVGIRPSLQNNAGKTFPKNNTVHICHCQGGISTA